MRQLILLVTCLCLTGCGGAISRMFGFGAEVPKPTYNPFVNNDWSSGLDILFLWSNAMSVVMIAASIAILFWVQLPSIRKWAWMGITFGLIMLGLGISFFVLKLVISFVVMGGAVLMLGILVWYLVINFDTIKQFVHKDKQDLTPSAKNLVEICENLPQKISN